MRKLKLALILPIVQVLLAVALFAWGNHQWRTRHGLFVPAGRLLCFAINAPAELFSRLLDLFPAWSAPRIWGFYFDELFFLPGVAILWFLIGRTLDKLRVADKPIGGRMTVSKALVNLFLLVYGVDLFWKQTAQWLWYRNQVIAVGTHYYDASLYWAWSAVLILVPVLNFANAIRRGPTGRRVT